MRVAVVAEWYPSPADPVLGVWAHRQAVAARDAGAEVRVLALRRPVPPLSAVRSGPRGLARWARAVPGLLRPLELDGIPVTPVRFLAPPRPSTYGSWGRWMAPPLARALDELRARWPFDLVHAHNVAPTGHAALSWIRRAGAAGPALAVSTHGPDIIHVARAGRGARELRAAIRGADLLIANSRWALERSEATAGRPLHARIVHLGADLPAEPSARHDRATLVTLGHLVARKRHAVVLRALASMPSGTAPDYVVIGDGPGRAPLEELARELGIAERVRFTGQLEHPRALAELARCHLFAMPGVEEPFGVAFVEAMAAGLPAIGAQGEGGPEDIAAAGEGMLLVPPDDAGALAQAIVEVLADRKRLERLGVAARETVARHFTWEHCGRATVDAYRAAIEARG